MVSTNSAATRMVITITQHAKKRKVKGCRGARKNVAVANTHTILCEPRLWRRECLNIRSRATLKAAHCSTQTQLDTTMHGSSRPTLREQSMVRKVCAMTALNSRLQKEATARQALRVSSGAISEGYSQARGP